MMIQNRNVLICGATSGIGFAMVENCLNQGAQKVFATYRKTSDLEGLKTLKEKFSEQLVIVELDADEASSYEKLKEQTGPVDVIFNNIGILHGESLEPERRIEDFEWEKHLQVYETNTIPTLMLAKTYKQSLKESNAPIFVSVSAKVGSIGDNKMGGWYSYRVSKVALNMVIKNLSIEFGRLNKKSLFVAIHPGTTETKLSEPFMAGARKKYKIHTPKETAENILNVVSNLTPERDNGSFYSWDGQKLPW